MLDDQESVSISDISAKQIYHNPEKHSSRLLQRKFGSKSSILANVVSVGKKFGKMNTNTDHEDKDLWIRLRHRILPTNLILQKMRMVNDNKCEEEETIEHLLIYCRNT